MKGKLQTIKPNAKASENCRIGEMHYEGGGGGGEGKELQQLLTRNPVGPARPPTRHEDLAKSRLFAAAIAA